MKSPELRNPAPISIRYHHFTNWLAIVRDWQGIDIFNWRKSYSPKNTLPTRPNPWEVTDPTYKKYLPEEIRKFAEEQAQKSIDYFLEEYQEDREVQKKLQSALQLIKQLEANQNQQVIPNILTSLSTFIQVIGLDFSGWGVVYGTEDRKKLLALLLSDPEAFTTKIDMVIAFNELEIQKSAESEVSPKQMMSLVTLPKVSQSLLELLQNDPTQRELIEVLCYFIHPDTRPLLAYDSFYSQLKKPAEFKAYLEDYLAKTEASLIYTQDVIGMDPAVDNPLTRATYNQRFLTYYSLLKTATLWPDTIITFTLNPDQICKTCRGGENGMGDHCTAESTSHELNGDQLVQKAMFQVLTKPTLPSVIRDQITMKYAEDGSVTEILLPVRFFFDVELTNDIQKRTRQLIMSEDV